MPHFSLLIIRERLLGGQYDQDKSDYSIFLDMMPGDHMNKEKLVKKIKELLKTDNDLSFLMEFKRSEIETLIACIRDRLS